VCHNSSASKTKRRDIVTPSGAAVKKGGGDPLRAASHDFLDFPVAIATRGAAQC